MDFLGGARCAVSPGLVKRLPPPLGYPRSAEIITQTQPAKFGRVNSRSRLSRRIRCARADGLVSRTAPGPQNKLDDAQMAELRALVIASPDAAIHAVALRRSA